MNKEEQFLLRRFVDLSRQAYQKNIVVFSDFLNMYEIGLLYQGEKEYACSFSLYGGYEYAERQMVSFQPDALYYEWNYPIACLKFTPRNRRFSDDSLSHRDVLGALMSLGIDRSRLGDILLEDDRIYLFCEESIAGFLLEELRKVRHTMIEGEQIQSNEFQPILKFEERCGFIASNRLDAFVAQIFRLSRTQAQEALQSEKVFLNSRCVTNPNQKLQPGDILSVRGMGKIIFDQFNGQSKKGRTAISYRIYK